MTDTSRPPRRRLQFFLRDFRLVDASVALPDGVTLYAYLARRRGYVPVLDARWTPSGESVPFAVVKRDQMLYAMAPDGDVPHVAAGSTLVKQAVEMLLEGGLFVRGELPLSEGQRLVDYLDTAGPFLPVAGVVLLRSGRPPKRANVTWGDIALNQDVIQAIWESEPAEEPSPRRTARGRAGASRDE
jgi:hypothetical protein